MFRAIPLCLIAGAFASLIGIQPSRYDLVIVRGVVVDGSGAARAPRRRRHQGRPDRRDRRTLAGRLQPRRSTRPVSSSRQASSTSTPTPTTSPRHPRAENFVRMGVTSIVAGNCGSSALDVGEALTTIRQTGVSVNFATLIGHNTVRRAVMGTDESRSHHRRSWPGCGRWSGGRWPTARSGFSTGPAIRAGHLRQDAGDHRSGADRRQRRRRLRVAHAQRRHRRSKQAVAETIRIGEMAGARSRSRT